MVIEEKIVEGMNKTLEIINELKDKGLIEDYVIGGGIATVYYVESFFTKDLDIFVKIKTDLLSRLDILGDVYTYLDSKGYKFEGEHIMIEGMPVQFLVASSGVEKDAMTDAKEIVYDGVNTKIMGPEYLIATALAAGRAKDKDKVHKFVEQKIALDDAKLDKILKEYGLDGKYRAIKDS